MLSCPKIVPRGGCLPASQYTQPEAAPSAGRATAAVVPPPAMASWLWKQLRTSVLIHKSVKFQIIDDPRVVVVAWLIKIGVVVYVSWALFFQFKYFKLEVLAASTVARNCFAKAR